MTGKASMATGAKKDNSCITEALAVATARLGKDITDDRDALAALREISAAATSYGK